MTDNNLPAPTGPVDTPAPTYNDQVEGLADFLDDDPETDPAEGEGHDAADDADEDIINAEDADKTDDNADDDGPPDAEFKSGRFAADDAKVTLDNGKVISVRDLKSFAETREKELQRGTTQKFQELSAKQAEVDQQAQSLSQSLEYLNWYAENYLPKAPEPPKSQDDYVGWINYQKAKETYDNEQQLRAYFTEQTQAIGQRKQQEMAQANQQRLQSEVQTLAAKDGLFKDQAKAMKWFERAAQLGAEYYGFTPQEIGNTVSDHRLVLALRDAFRYRAQKAKAANIREEVGKAPVIAPGGRRAEPRARVSKEKQARSEQLRREGTLEAGINSLMDLDL